MGRGWREGKGVMGGGGRDSTYHPCLWHYWICTHNAPRCLDFRAVQSEALSMLIVNSLRTVVVAFTLPYETEV